VIILFDEQGTPTFKEDRETNYFLSAAITYNLSDENAIFKDCDTLVGLSNVRPLRNRNINNNRATEIVNLIIQLPIQVVIASLELSNIEFQETIKLHEDLCNLIRDRYGNRKRRHLAHILHTRIVDECIFNSICDYSERHQNNSNFLINIDDWSISEDDIEIYLTQRSQSFEEKINILFRKYNFPFHIKVPSISLLNVDNARKRLIGVVTSVVSKSFIYQTNNKHSDFPIIVILSEKTNKYIDITNKTINFFKIFWNETLRNPPVL
jgi:hypothetical protein